MKQEELSQDQKQEQYAGMNTIRIKRLGLAVILAAVLTTSVGLNECMHIVPENTSVKPATQEHVIHDNFINNGSGVEYIQGSVDSTPTTNSVGKNVKPSP